MTPSVIKTESQYRDYLNEIERLAPLDPKPGTPDGDRFELLVVLTEKYEKERFPISAPTPVEAILFRMEEMGLQRKDLIPYIGSKSRVSEVLGEKRSLTVKMIRDLTLGLGIPAEALVGTKTVISETADDDWKTYPTKEMIKRGWIKPVSRSTSSGASLQAFFDQVWGSSGQLAYLRHTVHFGGIDKIDTRALDAWLARVIIKSREDKTAHGRFQPIREQKEFLSEIAKLSWFNDGPILAREYLQKKGIALVVQRHLPKTRVDGAVTTDRDGTPVIGLSLRHDRVDNFWYTLMHELAHLCFHISSISSQNEAYVDDTEVDGDEDQKEIEANRAARDAFVPRNIWQRSDAYRLQTVEAINALANELRIHPAIVAGRIRKETGNYRLFPNLVGSGAVRRLFPEWEKS